MLSFLRFLEGITALEGYEKPMRDFIVSVYSKMLYDKKGYFSYVFAEKWEEAGGRVAGEFYFSPASIKNPYNLRLVLGYQPSLNSDAIPPILTIPNADFLKEITSSKKQGLNALEDIINHELNHATNDFKIRYNKADVPYQLKDRWTDPKVGWHLKYNNDVYTHDTEIDLFNYMSDPIEVDAYAREMVELYRKHFPRKGITYENALWLANYYDLNIQKIYLMGYISNSIEDFYLNLSTIDLTAEKTMNKKDLMPVLKKLYKASKSYYHKIVLEVGKGISI